MTAQLDSLKTEITNTVGEMQSALTLIDGLGAALTAAIAANAAGDTAALPALAASLAAERQALAAAR